MDDRKETAAFYTPADVADYITERTLLPFLLDQAQLAHPDLFVDQCPVWQRLQTYPDHYIFRALKQETPLTLETPTLFSARRHGYRKLHRLIAAGQVHAVNDLVTLNLDIREFTLDAIRQAPIAFAETILYVANTCTVLDPTCGDGAFLFAAGRLLDAVKQVCTQRLPARRGKSLRPAKSCRNLHGIDLRPAAVEQTRHALQKQGYGEQLIHTGDVLAFDWHQAFSEVMERGGFDVVIGNPPYLAASAQKAPAAVRSFATAKCPDVYAWVLEQSAHVLRVGGRTGMIVPLSLAFSRAFAPCRKLLFAAYGPNWFASFGRIPSALFHFDIRVRNTVHLGHKSGSPSDFYTTRLHRWFDASRPDLLGQIEYARFNQDAWPHGIPKLGSGRLCRAFEDCQQRTSARLADFLKPQPTPFVLHFKKTAYNWLAYCAKLPPCADADGRPIPQTQFDPLYFANAWQRDVAFLLLNGKWTFAWWSIVGDDFHVARWNFAEWPIDLETIPPVKKRRLRALARKLESAMQRAASFKRNAGKRIGSYNLARCRAITDQSDQILGEVLGLNHVWPDVELLVQQIVKTEFAKRVVKRKKAQPAPGSITVSDS